MFIFEIIMFYVFFFNVVFEKMVCMVYKGMRYDYLKIIWKCVVLNNKMMVINLIKVYKKMYLEE